MERATRRWSSAAIHCAVLALAVALAAAAVAEPPSEPSDPLFDEFDEELQAQPAGFPDPLERTNRSVFSFNDAVDKVLIDPVSRFYGFIFPGPVKKSIRRLFANLGEPGTIANDLLQLQWRDAGVAGARFVVNSTIGLGGLFDPATHFGLASHRSDFGQTLAIAGTPSGAYVVLPVLGPTNVRDGFGVMVDVGMHPLTWFIGPTNFLMYGVYGGGQGLTLREEKADQLNALRAGSIDYYAVMRNAFYQNRVAEMWARREHRREDWAD